MATKTAGEAPKFQYHGKEYALSPEQQAALRRLVESVLRKVQSRVVN